MLIEHGIHDVDESFVTRKKTMTATEQVTLEPALAHMFAKHFDYPTNRRQVLISGKKRFHKDLVGDLIQCIQAVGSGLIRAEYAEILGFEIQLHYVAQKHAEDPGRFRAFSARFGDLHRVLSKVGKNKTLQQ